MRKLNVAGIDQQNRTGCTWTLAKLLLYVLGGASAYFFAQNFTELRQELSRHYQKAFERLSHETRTLCSTASRANYTPLVHALATNIVGQQRAHAELEQWLLEAPRNHHHFSCALLVGGTGVGKSLTAATITKHYPWPENVFIVGGKEHASNARKRYDAFKVTLFNLRQGTFIRGRCTHHLVVMDHLTVGDMQLVARVSDRLRAVSDKHKIFLHVLFVFRGISGHTFHPDAVKKVIPEARLIEFSSLTTADVSDCVRREASTLGIDAGARLNGASIVELVTEQIDAARVGCKPVRAKLSMYTTLQFDAVHNQT
uniref:AAA+ ATPase domain-containing protein n=1 Tax=Anopheles farauti TaxID=69004 RepID=A0A182Q163_9DIPT